MKNTPWGSSFRAPQQILHGELFLAGYRKPLYTKT